MFYLCFSKEYGHIGLQSFQIDCRYISENLPGNDLAPVAGFGETDLSGQLLLCKDTGEAIVCPEGQFAVCPNVASSYDCNLTQLLRLYVRFCYRNLLSLLPDLHFSIPVSEQRGCLRVVDPNRREWATGAEGGRGGRRGGISLH